MRCLIVVRDIIGSNKFVGDHGVVPHAHTSQAHQCALHSQSARELTHKQCERHTTVEMVVTLIHLSNMCHFVMLTMLTLASHLPLCCSQFQSLTVSNPPVS